MQFSEEIEGRVSEKINQKHKRTRTEILCALSRLDQVLLNSHFLEQSGNILRTSRHVSLKKKPRIIENCSQNDPPRQVNNTENSVPHTIIPELSSILQRSEQFEQFVVSDWKWNKITVIVRHFFSKSETLKKESFVLPRILQTFYLVIWWTISHLILILWVVIFLTKEKQFSM